MANKKSNTTETIGTLTEIEKKFWNSRKENVPKFDEKQLFSGKLLAVGCDMLELLNQTPGAWERGRVCVENSLGEYVGEGVKFNSWSLGLNCKEVRLGNLWLLTRKTPANPSRTYSDESAKHSSVSAWLEINSEIFKSQQIWDDLNTQWSGGIDLSGSSSWDTRELVKRQDQATQCIFNIAQAYLWHVLKMDHIILRKKTALRYIQKDFASQSARLESQLLEHVLSESQKSESKKTQPVSEIEIRLVPKRVKSI